MEIRPRAPRRRVVFHPICQRERREPRRLRELARRREVVLRHELVQAAHDGVLVLEHVEVREGLVAEVDLLELVDVGGREALVRLGAELGGEGV